MNSTVKKLCCAIFIILILCGCSNVITEDQLIGGKWTPKSGYKDGKPSGDPQCPYLNKGIEFQDKETVYVEDGGIFLKYSLNEARYGMHIYFYNPNGDLDGYEIIIENEDNLALIGSGTSEGFNCYFERQK